jgi:hypothetical protein
MEIKNIKNKLFSIAILIYLLVTAVFFGKVLFDTFRKPVAVAGSEIPELSKNKLESVNEKLETRQSLEYESGEIDLSEYQFGVSEPFR